MPIAYYAVNVRVMPSTGISNIASGWFSKIESRERALKIIKDTSMGFFFIAALQALLSLLVGFTGLIDAAIFAVGGFLLRRFNSRAAAVVLLLLATIGVGGIFASKAGVNLGGGNNAFLVLIILWAAIRAVEATLKLRGRFSAEAATSESPHT